MRADRPRLTGDQRDDYVGRWLDIADLDGDGCHEVLVSESYEWHQLHYRTTADRTTEPQPSAVHILRTDAASGHIANRSWAQIPATTWLGAIGWGQSTAILGDGTIAVRGLLDTLSEPIQVVAIPSGGGVVDPRSRQGYIVDPNPGFGWGPVTVGRCGDGDLCVSTFDKAYDTNDYSGQVLRFHAPITGPVDLEQPTTAIFGDDGDRAEVFEGRMDLDGDGHADWVIGAYYRNVGSGAVGVVHTAVSGAHGLWDVAEAAYVGTTAGGYFGLSVTAGDLDGDGLGEVVVGAPMSSEPGLYVFRGPHDTDLSDTEAYLQIPGASGSWIGYGAGIGDLDGDGAADLVVGRPQSTYTGEVPGEVLVYLAPTPGVWTESQADVVLTSGVGEPDGFGLAIEIAQLDGDGRADLVVGAPVDPTAGREAGSVTLVFAASIPW
ncbi:MAG: VCBS repeat-containing protein [Myxococcota bacterium]